MTKVFLSYSSKDIVFATKLAEDMRNEGLIVWFDKWIIDVGKSITQEIIKGLDDAYFVVVVLTSHSVNSGWVEMEWQSKIGEEAVTRETIILPAKLENCKIPPILKDKRYADFTGEYEQAKNDLLNAMDCPRINKKKNLSHPEWIDIIKEYRKQYIERYCKINLKDMKVARDVNLERIYVPIDLLSTDGIIRTKTDESKYRIRAIDVANENQFLLVIGGPGTGKTTFLRHIGLEALKTPNSLKNNCIPVYIKLVRIDQNEINFEKEIQNEFKSNGIQLDKRKITELLEEGKLLILFDGLDEVPFQRFDTVAIKITEFVDEHSNSRVIVSTRESFTSSDTFGRFMFYKIASFNDKQIKDYIEKWFKFIENIEENEEKNTLKNTTSRDKCLEIINKEEYCEIKEIARNPLFLTIICALPSEKLYMPKNPSNLYRDVLDILLDKWPNHKGPSQFKPNPMLPNRLANIDVQKQLLFELAAYLFLENKVKFRKNDLVNRIEKFLDDPSLDASVGLDILKVLEIGIGIIIQEDDEPDSYLFAFKLRDYLFASYLGKESKRIRDAVSNNLFKQRRWPTVFEFIAGNGSSIDEYFAQIIEETSLQLCNGKLLGLINWADNISNHPKSVDERITYQIIALKEACSLASDLDIAKCWDIDKHQSDEDLCIKLKDVTERAHKRARSREYAINVASILASSSMNIDLIQDSRVESQRINTLLSARALIKVIDKEDTQEIIAAKRIFEESRQMTRNLIPESISRIKHLGVFASNLDNDLIKIHTDAIKLSKQKAVDKDEFSCLIDDVFRALRLPKNTVELSAKNWESLSNYFWGISILLRCKQATTLVRPKDWQAMLSQISKLTDLNVSIDTRTELSNDGKVTMRI